MHIQASPPYSDTAKIAVTAKEALTAKFAERIADVEMPEEARCTPLPCYSTLPYATSP